MNASSGNESLNDSQFRPPANRRAAVGGGALIAGVVGLPLVGAIRLESRSRRAYQTTIRANDTRLAQGTFAA